MNEEDMHKLDESLKANAGLDLKNKEEVEHYELVMSIKKLALKEELEQIHQKRKSRFKIRWVKYAAMAAGVLLAVFYFLKPKEDLYQTYFYTDAGLPVVMGLNTNLAFAKAMNAYKMGNYAEAQEQFTSLAKEKPGNDTLNYYIAMSSLNQNKSDLGVRELEQIGSSSVFYDKALFFRALVDIKNNNKKDAQELLSKSKHPHAERLLKELSP